MGSTAKISPQEFWPALNSVISASVANWELIVFPKISPQMDWVKTEPAKWNQMVPFLERERCTAKVRSKIFQYLQDNYENIFHLGLQTVKKQTNCAALVCSSKQRAIKIAVGMVWKESIGQKNDMCCRKYDWNIKNNKHPTLNPALLMHLLFVSCRGSCWARVAVPALCAAHTSPALSAGSVREAPGAVSCATSSTRFWPLAPRTRCR